MTRVSLGEALQSAAVFTDGDWVESKDQDPNGRVRLVQLADIGVGRFINKSARFLTEEKAADLRCTFLEPGDVLVARMPDPLGRACIYPGTEQPSVTVVDVCVIRPDPTRVDARFLMHAFNGPSLQHQVQDFATGSTRTRISRGNMKKCSIVLPPLDEQRRIAAILDQADALRAKRRQALTHLDDLTPSVFAEMFGRHSWSSTLGDLAEVQIGPFGSLLHKSDYVSGGIAVLNPMHIRAGELEPDPEFSVSEEKAASLARYRLRQGDIVLGRRGEMGRAGVVRQGQVGMLCGTGSLILRPRRCRSIFLHAVVTSARMKDHLERNSLGATLPNLNAGIVKSSPAPDPNQDLQQAFEMRLMAITRTRSAMLETAAVDADFFAALQSSAFRGEL